MARHSSRRHLRLGARSWHQAALMRYTGNLPGIYFVGPDMLEKKHRHTHIKIALLKVYHKKVKLIITV